MAAVSTGHGRRRAHLREGRRPFVVGADQRRRRPSRAHAGRGHRVPVDRPAGGGRAPGAHRGDPRSGHEWGTRTGNRIEALFKPIGVVEGISDVPWHKDCSLGRHSYECYSLTVGISVTGADATSGQLRVVAGSHRALVWPAFVRRDNDLPIVDLPTQTGDVTMHLSCTLHMAQPPVERERRVLYTGFRLPPANPEATRAARERLGKVREAAPVTVSHDPSAGHPGKPRRSDATALRGPGRSRPAASTAHRRIADRRSVIR